MKYLLTILILLLITYGFATTGFGFSGLVAFDTLDPTVELIAPGDGEFFPAGAWVNLSWNASDGNLSPNSVRLELGSPEDEQFVPLAELLPQTGSFSWQSPADTLLYAILRVTALDDFGNMGYAQNLEPIIIGPVIPAPPQSLNLSAIGTTDLLLSWNPVTTGTFGQALDPDGYLVFFNASSPTDFAGYVLLADVGTDSSYLHQAAFSDENMGFYLICAYLELSREQRARITALNKAEALTLSEFMSWRQK